MNRIHSKIVLMFGLLLVPLSTWAIQPDTLRGRVLDVDESERTLTVRVLEVGENVHVTTDTERTFTIPESADIVAGLKTDVLDDQLDEIREGVVVTMEMDVDSPDSAQNVRYQE